MTKDDIDFIKSMCFQGPDMTQRQESRIRRIIDDMRMLIASEPILEKTRDEDEENDQNNSKNRS